MPMHAKVASYLAAARLGADWLLTQQNPDGSFVKPDLQADIYHKAVLALGLTGHAPEAQRLLTWIKANDLQEGGKLRRFDDGLALYKTSWICQGAHRLGRFDLSAPVMEYILSCQAPCGGFSQTRELNQYVEPVCTAWAGVCSIYMGRMDAALRAADCLARMVVTQPDPMRFYFHMTPEGELLTDDGAPFVDAHATQQAYYCPGIAHQFFMRLHLATGDAAYLKLAEDLFEFSLRCAEDRYAFPTAGKSAVAAALQHMVTGDLRARDAACELADYEVGTQSAEGWWRNPNADNTIIRLDHTAEFVVWLTDIAGILGGTLQ